jgi:hypothetical protein
MAIKVHVPYVAGLTKTQADTYYIGKTGAASSATVAFTEPSTYSAPATGDTLATIVGKVSKKFSDLAAIATSGSYTDLSNVPTSVAASTLTGTVAIANGGTGQSTAAAALTALGVTVSSVDLTDGVSALPTGQVYIVI